MENRYKISYDIKQKNIVNISFMQGDVDTSVIEVQLFDNGQVVDITGETIEFRFLKPDGTIVFQDESTGVNILDAEEGIFECVLMANTLAVAGAVRTEIVRKKDGFILTCPTFNFIVKQSINNMVLSSNYIESIENKMIEWQLNEDLRVEVFETNERIRENKFQENEIDRENRFEQLIVSKQQDAEIIDARDGEVSLRVRLERDKADSYETYLLSSMLSQETLQQKRALTDLEAEIDKITLTNSETFPFNNSVKTVALQKQRNTLNYRVITEVVSADGEVGDVIITDKQLNGFKIAFTGSAKNVTIKYYVQGGMYQ